MNAKQLNLILTLFFLNHVNTSYLQLPSVTLYISLLKLNTKDCEHLSLDKNEELTIPVSFCFDGYTLRGSHTKIFQNSLASEIFVQHEKGFCQKAEGAHGIQKITVPQCIPKLPSNSSNFVPLHNATFIAFPISNDCEIKLQLCGKNFVRTPNIHPCPNLPQLSVDQSCKEHSYLDNYVLETILDSTIGRTILDFSVSKCKLNGLDYYLHCLKRAPMSKPPGEFKCPTLKLSKQEGVNETSEAPPSQGEGEEEEGGALHLTLYVAIFIVFVFAVLVILLLQCFGSPIIVFRPFLTRLFRRNRTNEDTVDTLIMDMHLCTRNVLEKTKSKTKRYLRRTRSAKP